MKKSIQTFHWIDDANQILDNKYKDDTIMMWTIIMSFNDLDDGKNYYY